MAESQRQTQRSKKSSLFCLKQIIFPSVLFVILFSIYICFHRSDRNFYSPIHQIIKSEIKLIKRHFLPILSWMPFWKINSPHGIIDRRLPTVMKLDEDAQRLLPLVDKLKEHRFFRIFKADLTGECPFWAREEMCTEPGACTICECDDDEIPQSWKQKPTRNFVDRNHYNKDGVLPWGEGMETSEFSQNAFNTFLTVSDEKSKEATYVDLSLNRPGFTSYKGRNIWNLIYKENCMSTSLNPLKTTKPNLSECTEEEAFHKIVSGMQTAIMVLAAEYHTPTKPAEDIIKDIEQYKAKGQILDSRTFRSQYYPSLNLFRYRVAGVREWMENLYFTFGVLLKTFCHVGPILESCDCDTGFPDDDEEARQGLLELLQQPFSTCQEVYLDEPLFKRKQALALKQFKNISRVMDCLECEKCRLHGKVKILALEVALRASGKDAKVRTLERNEIIALVNALEYFADSIISLHKFKVRLFWIQFRWILTFCVGVIGILVFCFNFSQCYKKNMKPHKGSD